MIKKLGFQLYTVRDFIGDYEFADVAFGKLAKMGYTEVQTFGRPFDEKLFYELLQKHGISVIGTHYDLKKICEDPEGTVALHRMWNTTNIGIGSLPPVAHNNLTELKAFIKQFNDAAAIYAKEGFKLTYHNHSFEFVRIDGYKTIMDVLFEELDPENTSFVLDTCWVAAGAGDVTQWMEKLKGRIDILHLKDACIDRNNYAVRVTEVGNGNLAWDKIIATAEEIGVKHYIVEQDNGFNRTPFNSLKMSADFLAKYKV